MKFLEQMLVIKKKYVILQYELTYFNSYCK